MSKSDKKRIPGFLKFIMALIIIIIILLVGGSFYFKGNIPEQVQFSDHDISNFYLKTGIKQSDYNFDMMDLLTGNVIASGSLDVDAKLTGEELTAFLQGHSADLVSNTTPLQLPFTITAFAETNYSGSTGFTDFNARIIGEDQIQIFANISENIDEIYTLISGLDNYSFIVDRAAGANLSIVLHLTYEKSSGFDAKVSSLHVNGIPVPSNLIDEYEPQLTSLLNRSIANEDIFKIDVFKIYDDYILFQGTMPEYLEVK